MILLEKVALFRGLYVQYASVCEKRHKEVRLHGSSSGAADRRREVELRTELRRMLGEIQPLTDRLSHVGWWYTNTGTNVSYHVLDNSLQEIGIQQPGVLHLALHAIDKTIGALRSMTPAQRVALSGRRRRLFFAHSFKESIATLVSQVRAVAEAQGFEVVEGEPPQPGSVSQKVQRMIESCDACLALLTADTTEGDLLKASEWVRQEAVFAKGRSMPVVRVIESGVDPEGRLLGDDEYLEVDLRSPANAIVRIVRMLASLGRER